HSPYRILDWCERWTVTLEKRDIASYDRSFAIRRCSLKSVVLFPQAESAHPIESEIEPSPVRDSKVPIIFVFGKILLFPLSSSIPRCSMDVGTRELVSICSGGPGSGKGTQCEKISAKYGYKHVSTGDLLREEVQSGSTRGQELSAIMAKGNLVPMDVVLDLLKERMVSLLQDAKGYLIDGYPREVVQAIAFENKIAPCSLVIYFNVSDDTMTKRLTKRGETSGRVDDNEETIRKRLQTFHNQTKPVLDKYVDITRTVPAEGEIDAIFAEVCKAIDSCIPQSK
ncbi:unnamed protein product, partial [Darwinula stevensoni]